MDDAILSHHREILRLISKYNFDRIPKLRGANLEKIFYLSSFRLSAERSSYQSLLKVVDGSLIDDLIENVSDARARGVEPLSHFGANMAVWYLSSSFNLEITELERELHRKKLIEKYELLFKTSDSFKFGDLYNALYSIYGYIDVIRKPIIEKRWNNTNKSFYKRNQVSLGVQKSDKTFDAGWSVYYNLRLLALHKDQTLSFAQSKGFGSLAGLLKLVPKYDRFSAQPTPSDFCFEYFGGFTKVLANLEAVLDELFFYLINRRYAENDAVSFEFDVGSKPSFMAFDYVDYNDLLVCIADHYARSAA